MRWLRQMGNGALTRDGRRAGSHPVNPSAPEHAPPAPQEDDLLSTAPDWEIWKPRLTVPQWLRDNPGLVFTAIYLALSVIGLLYQFLFFRR